MMTTENHTRKRRKEEINEWINATGRRETWTVESHLDEKDGLRVMMKQEVSFSVVIFSSLRANPYSTSHSHTRLSCVLSETSDDGDDEPYLLRYNIVLLFLMSCVGVLSVFGWLDVLKTLFAWVLLPSCLVSSTTSFSLVCRLFLES
jgi:hypothetical protein